MNVDFRNPGEEFQDWEAEPASENKLRTLQIIEKESKATNPGFSFKRREEVDPTEANEICAKYNKGDFFDYTLVRTGNRFEIMLEGVKVGAFSIHDNGDTKSIGMIMLNENLQRKGFGEQLYKELNDYFFRQDRSVLMSDSNRNSGGATALWMKLKAQGLAEELPEGSSADEHPMFRFKKK